MPIDNLVTDFDFPLGVDRSLAVVTLSATIPNLFVNDDVRWDGKVWRVWKINGFQLTLRDPIDAKTKDKGK